jgi:hypothetical protein
MSPLIASEWIRALAAGFESEEQCIVDPVTAMQ